MIHASVSEASKWLSRQNAIQSVAAHVEPGKIESYSPEVKHNTSCILKIVKEHTRGFRETNVNIMKAIIGLFTTLCDYHEAKEIEFPAWGTHDGVVLAVHKISDRKVSSNCKELLSMLCVVSDPSAVLDVLARQTQSAKSPIVHEEVLRWFQGFCKDFGALSVGSILGSLVPWVIDVSSIQFSCSSTFLYFVLTYSPYLRRSDHRTPKSRGKHRLSWRLCLDRLDQSSKR